MRAVPCPIAANEKGELVFYKARLTLSNSAANLRCSVKLMDLSRQASLSNYELTSYILTANVVRVKQKRTFIMLFLLIFVFTGYNPSRRL
jgi:hypothetical protein